MGLQLSMKKIKVRTTGKTIEGVDVIMVDSFCLLGSVINNKGPSNREIWYRLALDRRRMKELEKIVKCNKFVSTN